MKQTAVEWLIYEHFGGIENCTPDFRFHIEKAKEMEKQQKKDFFNAGVRYGSGSVMANEWGEDTEEYNFEQYYNETFKSEQNEKYISKRNKIP